MSKGNISKLRQAIEKALDEQFGLENLVDVPQPDREMAIDETFFKIGGTPIYFIIATGYTTRKTLGICVSTSHKEVDPYRKKLKFSKGCLASVAAGLNITFSLFARMSAQNNLAENINCVVKTLLNLRGPKSIESMHTDCEQL